jgi:hypothetical protein
MFACSLNGTLKGMVATPEEGRGKAGNDHILPIMKKDAETGNAAHTLHVENEMNGEVLGRASGTSMKSVIALGEGPMETSRAADT